MSNETVKVYRCPRCRTTLIIYRLRIQSYLCQRCGWQGTEPTIEEPKARRSNSKKELGDAKA